VVEFPVYQGESRFVADNVKLGTVRVPVPPRRAGIVAVDCRFSYDASGLLEVDVTVPETGESRQLVIVGDDGAEDSKALAKRRAELARLKLHPRDEDANRAVLERAKRCFENQLGETRLYVGQLISQFEGALDTQETKRVAAAREETVKALDEVEGERFL
jgi:molecular chaperone HscC